MGSKNLNGGDSAVLRFIRNVELMFGVKILAKPKKNSRLSFANRSTFTYAISRNSNSPLSENNGEGPVGVIGDTVESRSIDDVSCTLTAASDENVIPVDSVIFRQPPEYVITTIEDHYVDSDAEDPFFVELYEDLASESIVNDIMPAIVPEVFFTPPEYIIAEIATLSVEETSIEVYRETAFVPEYVISEIATLSVEETSIDIEDPFYLEVYDEVAAACIVNDVMPAVVPEVFFTPPEYIIADIATFSVEETSIEIEDPFYLEVYDEVAAACIVNDVMPTVVPEVFFTPPEYVITTIEDHYVDSNAEDPFFVELYEDLASECIVNDVMPAIVPEVFFTPPEYVITTIEDHYVDSDAEDPFFVELYEDLASECIVNDIMPAIVPEVFSHAVEENDSEEEMFAELLDYITAMIIVNEVMPVVTPYLFDSQPEYTIIDDECEAVPEHAPAVPNNPVAYSAMPSSASAVAELTSCAAEPSFCEDTHENGLLNRSMTLAPAGKIPARLL